MRELFEFEKWRDFHGCVGDAGARTEACVKGSREKLARYRELAREGDHVILQAMIDFGYVAKSILRSEYSHFFSMFNT